MSDGPQPSRPTGDPSGQNVRRASPERDRWRAIDHVQLAIPAGGEAAARAFYVDVLGFDEVVKPPVMAARGGCWFESGSVRVHVGVDPEFRPAGKAHPALVVSGLADLVAATRLEIAWSDEIAATVRGFVHDPFGNRIELIDAGEP